MLKHELAKHDRYLDFYKPNDFFWGIGIENETYLQLDTLNPLDARSIQSNHKRERYSVDYFIGLHPEYKDHLKEIFKEGVYHLPLFMNAHSFQNTDCSGNHKTTYEKVPKPNPLFQGQTVHEYLCKINPSVFKAKYKVNYTYDGDTIEFMTQNFYKGTVKGAVQELIREKDIYIEALNKALPHLRPIKYPLVNEPFVNFLTNRKNLAIFNNGTYHFNFTLPTQLDSKKQPANMTKFIKDHKAAIRYIQYIEPLLVAVYGTPDPFSKHSSKFSKASQRCAVSRYIGIGTYDTNDMTPGKLLGINTKTCRQAQQPTWWYTSYTKDSAYKLLDEIGADINFNKHGAHGIELRFLDWFPEEKLEELLTVLVHVLDVSLKYGCPADPTVCPIWNGLVVRVLEGGNVTLTRGEYEMYSKLFHLNMPIFLCWLFRKPSLTNTVSSVWAEIAKACLKVKGPCSKLMLA